MARTIESIYNQMVVEKESFTTLEGLTPLGSATLATLLDDINTISRAAVWRLVLYVVAVMHHLLEVEWDIHKTEVDTLASAQKFGSLGWYVAKAKEYQQGYVLAFVDDFPTYSQVDVAAQTISQASAQDTGQSVLLKVAKDNNGSPTALTSAELIAFTGYVQQVKPAGILVETVSLAADSLRIQLEVGYDPVLVPSDVLTEVEGVIQTYAENLPFDAKFKRLDFEDALQAITGVESLSIGSMQGVSGGVVETFTQEYVARAGYMVYDSINSNITMTPYA